MARSVLSLDIAWEYCTRKSRGERPSDILDDFTRRLGVNITGPMMIHYVDGHRDELDALSDARVRVVPDASRPRWKTTPVLYGTWAIMSDLQVPSQDSEWIKRFLDLCFSWGVQNVVVNGDFLNQDGASFFTVMPEESDLSEEFRIGREVARLIEDCYTGHKVFVEGNHDVRLQNAILKRIKGGDVARLYLNDPSKWNLTGCTRAYVNTWLVTHPSSTSVIPTRAAQFLALKYARPVVAAHGHLQGIAVATNGYTAIDSGIMADPERLSYATYRTTHRGFMAQGGVILTQRREGGPVYPYALRPSDDLEALARVYRPGDLYHGEEPGEEEDEVDEGE